MFKKEGNQSPSTVHSFAQHWPTIKVIIMKLLKNFHISKSEWQDLFHDIHMVCSWDEHGSIKLLEHLERHLIHNFFSLKSSGIAETPDNQDVLEEYVTCWREFSRLVEKFPVAFQQLDLAIRKSFPRPTLVPLDDQQKCFDSPVAALLQRLWDEHIIKSVLKKSEESAIANYCDLILRSRRVNRDARPSDDDNSTRRLEAIESFLSHIQDKVTFLRFHKFHLMKRLLLNSKIDIERERRFISKIEFQDEAIREQVYQIERNLKDIQASERITKQFLISMKPVYKLESVKTDNNNTIETVQDTSFDFLNIKVLNPMAWKRSLEDADMQLPDEILSVVPSFEAFYENRCAGRKLRWCHRLSNGVVEFSSKLGTYELEVSAAQLSVLTAFDRSNEASLKFEQLQGITRLSRLELRRTLWVSRLQLSLPHYRLVLITNRSHLNPQVSMQHCQIQHPTSGQ